MEWVNSDAFAQYSFIPLSKLRAISYIHNPHAQENDPLVFMMMEGNQPIAFRTVLPDTLHLQNGHQIKFVWLSGSWVNPSHRRKGLSTQLLTEVSRQWQGKLLYTNYAPQSKNLYDKTGAFMSIAKFSGIRYYTAAGVLEKLYTKLPILKKLRIFSGLILPLLKVRHSLYLRKGIKSSNSITLNPANLNQLDGFIQKRDKNSFRKLKADFDWINNYPWANQSTEAKKDAERYPFSCWSEDFFSKPLVVGERDSPSSAFLWPIIKNADLKLTYSHFGADQTHLLIHALLYLTEKHQIKSLTVWDKKLNMEMQKFHHPFVYSKKQNQEVFAHKSLMNTINEELKIDFGDGDNIFV